MGGPEVAGGSAVQEQLHSAGHEGAEVTGGCTGAPATCHVSSVRRKLCHMQHVSAVSCVSSVSCVTCGSGMCQLCHVSRVSFVTCHLSAVSHVARVLP